MTSRPATHTRLEDTATRARGLMDDAAAVEAAEAAQRELVGIGVAMWADSAWLAAGASSFQAWARTYTALSEREAFQLERVSQLCFDHPALADAVADGVLSLGRVRRLARWVTRDRRPYLTDTIVQTLLELNANTPGDDEAWGRAIAFWAEHVDQELAVTPEHQQRLYLSAGLFGGGELHGSLAPVTFETVAAALDAFIQDPDPQDAPYQRGLAERRADALDDLALFALTHADEDSIHPNPDDDLDVDGDPGSSTGDHPTDSHPTTDHGPTAASGAPSGKHACHDHESPQQRKHPGDPQDQAHGHGHVPGQNNGPINSHGQDRDQACHDPATPKHHQSHNDATNELSPLPIRPDQPWRPFDQPTTTDNQPNSHADGDGGGDDDWVYDGLGHRDQLDEQLDHLRHGGTGLDPLHALRRSTATKVMAQRRRARRTTKPRSGVTVNVHIDLPTLAGRHLTNPHGLDSFDGLVLRTDAWPIAERAARQLLCDSSLIATLFNGPGHVLDANDAAEHFNRAQRRAIATRDEHCVFPTCRRPPRFCDTHHLEHREHGGPTRVDNGCLLCRFHHRLIHQHHWKLHVTNGRWTATDPHGHTWTGQPPPNKPPGPHHGEPSDTQPSHEHTHPTAPTDPHGPSATTGDTPDPPMLC